ncbi:MAG: peptide deformylase [Calditrichia bacterium]|nr:peptide deformylase [Calditrichia bacterium]
MAVLPIIKIGHPTLRKIAERVNKFDQDLKDFVDNLIETMRLNEGVGLAATQVNVVKQVFVIDKGLIDEAWEIQVYINPEILESEGLENLEEGCLSIPGIRAEVERPPAIKVKYQNLDGKLIEEQLEGMLAKVFQHEFDHLNGVLFVDRIPQLIRKLLEPQIKEIEGEYTYQ